jgi:hypothetical protein
MYRRHGSHRKIPLPTVPLLLHHVAIVTTRAEKTASQLLHCCMEWSNRCLLSRSLASTVSPGFIVFPLSTYIYYIILHYIIYNAAADKYDTALQWFEFRQT